MFGLEHQKWQDQEKAAESAFDTGDLLATVGDPNARSPVPGVVEKILVQEGESVTKGQALMALNAMKMEFLIRFTII